MPTYAYSCPRCNAERDEVRTIAERDNPPDCCGWPMRRVFSAPNVVPDIAPYISVAADKETGRCQHIRSRKQHREFLKRNRYEEMGNDAPRSKPKTKEQADASGFIWGKP